MKVKQKKPAVTTPNVLTARDLSPISPLSSADEEWLRELACKANTDTLALSFASEREVEQAPLLSYDGQSGTWWAGRFVGEISYKGRTLTILPRFGMPALRRWLSRIWGIRLVASVGAYKSGRIWLWELVARLWASRLVAAAKHGLPRVRVDEVHVGTTVRGRLLVRPTAAQLHTGERLLTSRTRSRQIDPWIGGILLGTYAHLRGQLGHLSEPKAWLSERGHELVRELQAAVDRRTIEEACRSRSPMRYTPITESYRPVVELSRAILGGRPFMSSAEGSQEVLGVLLDMAEIWELYVYHLLRDGLSGAVVSHTGRSAEAVYWLLKGQGADRLGAMKPDIIVSAHGGGRRLILDAKYKLTTPSPERPQGILREDLYQMAGYLSVAADADARLDGGLIYPASDSIQALARRGPFRLVRSDARFGFFGLDCANGAESADLSEAEHDFVASVQALLHVT